MSLHVCSAKVQRYVYANAAAFGVWLLEQLKSIALENIRMAASLLFLTLVGLLLVGTNGQQKVRGIISNLFIGSSL